MVLGAAGARTGAHLADLADSATGVPHLPAELRLHRHLLEQPPPHVPAGAARRRHRCCGRTCTCCSGSRSTRSRPRGWTRPTWPAPRWSSTASTCWPPPSPTTCSQQAIFRAEGPDGLLREAVGRDLKGKLSPLIYLAGIAAAAAAGWPSLLFFGLVAAIWLVPDRRLEAYVARHGSRVSGRRPSSPVRPPRGRQTDGGSSARIARRHRGPRARTAPTTGAISRSARPRCEIASFAAGSSSAEVSSGSCRRGVLVGDEQHVVAEAAAPPLLADHAARHPAVHDDLAAGVAERHRAREVRAAALVRHVGQLGEQQRVVALVCPSVGAARRRRARPARGQHPGHPVQRVHAQAGVVGQRRAARWPRGRPAP